MQHLLRQLADTASNSTSNDFLKIFNEYQGFIALLAAGAAFAAVIIHGHLQKRQLEENTRLQELQIEEDRKNNEKAFKMQGLNLVYQKLNDLDERKARKAVVVAFYIYLEHNHKPLTYDPDSFFNEFLKESHPVHPDVPKEVRKYAERIKNNFEQIAVMEKNGMIDENMYFDAYYGSLLRCYGALEGHISASQENAGSKHFTAYYQEQSKRAVEYWRKHHPNARINYYDPDSNSGTEKKN